MISEFSFCEIPIKKSPANMMKRKIQAIVSMETDLLYAAKANTKPRANCRAAHISMKACLIINPKKKCRKARNK